MTFPEFQIRRAELLRQQPGLRDCAETNLYRALAHLAAPTTPPPTGTVHRCHLAQTWTELFGLPPEYARRALISSGVRDSLVRLFSHYASHGTRVWLPADNYPVFGELARAAGLQPGAFPTLGHLCLPRTEATGGVEILLLTNPLKPAGRWLTVGEVAELRNWLAASPQRRLLLDTVYTFTTSFHETTRTLLAAGQVTLLHSLTKGWLVPKLFGVTLVPEADFSSLVPAFRQGPPSQASLSQARKLMAQHAELPGKVAHELREAQVRLRAKLPVTWPEPFDAPDRYLFPIALPWEELLSRHGILGLPATTFGAERNDFTVLSSLGYLP
jgi:hypothetical protein